MIQYISPISPGTTVFLTDAQPGEVSRQLSKSKISKEEILRAIAVGVENALWGMISHDVIAEAVEHGVERLIKERSNDDEVH